MSSLLSRRLVTLRSKSLAVSADLWRSESSSATTTLRSKSDSNEEQAAGVRRRQFGEGRRRGTEDRGERAVKYVMLVIPVATFCLGTWQVYRRRWKLNLIATLQQKTSAEPIELPYDLQELDGLEYRKVRVAGTFDHSRELQVRPRSLFVDGREQDSGGIISSGRSNGLHVVTPFKLSDRDLTILVNRGWVSSKQAKPSSREAGQVEGEIELVGVVRLHENRGPFMPKHEPNSAHFLYRDVMAMARLVDAAPVFLDADVDSTVPGGPRGGQTKVSLRNEHLSYIFTWYSLSAATLFLWFRRYIKNRPLM